MKKLFLILALVSLTSCLGVKKSTENTSSLSVKELTDKSTDSTSKETINKGISDEAVFKVAESNTGDAEFDIRVNDAVTNILRSINFQKSSGDNSYSLYYDEQLRELKAQIQVGETRNAEVTANSEVVSQKESEKETTSEFKKVVTTLPWWVWIVAFVVFFKQIMGFIGNIYPPARGITSLAELFTQTKKET